MRSKKKSYLYPRKIPPKKKEGKKERGGREKLE